MNGFFSIIIIVLGSVAGMGVNYWLGNRFGRISIKKHGHKIHLPHEQFDRVEKWFERHEGLIIVVGYFIPVVRHISPIVAGILKFPIKKYFAYSTLGAFLWISGISSLGYFFGIRCKQFLDSLQGSFDMWIIIGIVLGLLLLLIKHRLTIKNGS